MVAFTGELTGLVRFEEQRSAVGLKGFRGVRGQDVQGVHVGIGHVLEGYRCEMYRSHRLGRWIVVALATTCKVHVGQTLFV